MGAVIVKLGLLLIIVTWTRYSSNDCLFDVKCWLTIRRLLSSRDHAFTLKEKLANKNKCNQKDTFANNFQNKTREIKKMHLQIIFKIEHVKVKMYIKKCFTT